MMMISAAAVEPSVPPLPDAVTVTTASTWLPPSGRYSFW